MPITTTIHGWVLETTSSAYALGINSAGLLVHRYWGRLLPFADDYPPPPESVGWSSFNGPGQLLPEEFPAYGDGLKYVEPCLKVSFANGVRDCWLRFAAAEVIEGTVPELRLTLRDDHEPLRLLLCYRLHEPFDLVERFATLYNEGQHPLLVERFFSAQWHLPGQGFTLTHATGRWNDEGHLRRDPLPHGTTITESRRLTSSHHHSPWFLADRGASETAGEAWYCALAWSGNWKLAAEVTDFGTTRLSLGLNDWDSALRLAPGAAFTSPPCVAGYTAEGWGGASRRFHHYIRARVLPRGNTTRPVLYNSWEATLFDVDERSQGELATIAAALGVELFVVDDGWFHRRSSDTAGLGDWWPDAQKFAHGLGPLIEHVNSLGMAFGLWLEPEMVNPDSDLYRAHPDWVIHFPTRPRTESRNQLILNLARADVQEHLIELLDGLLASNKITFVKWDMNRNVSEPGWPGAPEGRELWVRYVEGLYRVWGELARRHPQVAWQSCSGGGGRADLGILHLADQVWVSDNTEATARLRIQHAYSQLFPANSMECWVTDAAAELVPLRFRFHVAMCGVLGLGGNLLLWSEDERDEARALVAEYKAIRHLVQGGNLHRLRAPGDGFSALIYVAADQGEAVLFAFRTHSPDPVELPPLLVQGLAADSRYIIEGHGTRSGLAWASIGLQLELGNFESVLLRISQS